MQLQGMCLEQGTAFSVLNLYETDQNQKLKRCLFSPYNYKFKIENEE